MRSFDLYTPAATLRAQVEDLQVAWQRACDEWSDAAQDRFAREHLDPLGVKFKAALDAIERMANMMATAATECSDDDA